MKLMDHERGSRRGFQHRLEPKKSRSSILAEKVKELTHSDSEIVFVPYDEAYEEGFEDMPRRVPDTSKINQQVGFEPQMDLDGILKA